MIDWQGKIAAESARIIIDAFNEAMDKTKVPVDSNRDWYAKGYNAALDAAKRQLRLVLLSFTDALAKAETMRKYPVPAERPVPACGEWITEKSESEYFLKTGHYTEALYTWCSECGGGNGKSVNDKFCRHCGAKMSVPAEMRKWRIDNGKKRNAQH